MSEPPDIPGLTPAEALPDFGRARRFRLPEDEELWLLHEADRAVQQRLLELGAVGLGRFSRGGETVDELWLVRGSATPTLAGFLETSKQVPVADALEILSSLLRVLVFAEDEALFPGPLVLAQIPLHERRVEVSADELVASLLGHAEASPAAASSRASPRWTPPEQSEGAPWNNAANRYVIGLLMYRLLSGEHPFGGRGLRLALEARADRPPPPFTPEVAEQLSPGLQSLCLRCLEPDPSRRPRSAQEILDTLEDILSSSQNQTPPPATSQSRPGGESPEPTSRQEPRAPASAPPRAAVAPGQVQASRRWGGWWMLLGLCTALAAWWGLSRGRSTEPPPVRARAPLSASGLISADCASCHPRQAGEWRRSVMAHSVKSPLFLSLEMLIQEQAGKDFDCPNGAGILRKADARTACRDRNSGQLVTGAGGEHWCVNCHAPADNLATTVPAWNGRERTDNPTLREALSERALEGISCAFCHQVHPPTAGRVPATELGNPFWVSPVTGRRFSARPEDATGRVGISNSGYALDLQALFAGDKVPGGAHARPDPATREYLRSSDFCGACHDVRLFGTDVIGVKERGEHFKRLRNAYSEWSAWAATEERAGRTPASCQDCHMTQYPGVCTEEAGDQTAVASGLRDSCPPGTHFQSRPPGSYPKGLAATGAVKPRRLSLHYFSGVDTPLDPGFDPRLAEGDWTDVFSIPQSLSRRAKMLLAASVELSLGTPRLRGRRLELPVSIENTGAGHRVPAGFSQERELWVHLTVRDEQGRALYEVGRVDRSDQDLRDKVFLRVNTDDRFTDGQGRPQGLFGADVADGPDVPRWQPNPQLGGTQFRGLGLINFQNGFLRCVVCIGRVDFDGSCRALPGQDRARADRFADGSYDIDTGECRSNLSGENALFETYFPVGALDASRGVFKAADAIIDRRSLAPNQPVTYTYDLSLSGRPHSVEARLLFRAFPPFLIRAFIEYEAKKRPGRSLIGQAAMDRLEIVELAKTRVVLP